MPNDWFRFKQFLVRQDRCAMKVGTDGILLGAWCTVDGCESILDVGTGTGLIALMCAQRSPAKITAIEIDEASAEQAEENFEASKWSSRIKLVKEDFRISKSLEGLKFDMIVCNPPFFKESLKSSRMDRNIVRHDINLKLAELILGCKPLLNVEGRLSIILPPHRFDEVLREAGTEGLNLTRKTEVFAREGEEPLRILAEWSGLELEADETSMLIHQDKSSDYHPDFINLTKNFYLDRI